MPTYQETMTETGKMDYTITRLNKNNLKDLAWLHAEVYNIQPREFYFQNKYHTAYTGVENVGFIAYNHEKIPVAFYGVIPCFLQHGNKLMLSAQSADTMTHPKYRYKGMFVELSKLTFDLCSELGIKLIFGFPNQNSYHGAVHKLGWQLIHNMDCFTIKVNTLPLEKLSHSQGILRKIYKTYTSAVLKKYEIRSKGIESSALADGFAGIHRSSEYLSHKTYNETKLIGFDDVKIWISNHHGLMIGDMEEIDENNFSAVMAKFKNLAFWMGIKNIQFHCSPGTRIHGLFASQLKATPSFPALYQDLGSTIPPSEIRFTLADIDIF